MDTIIHDILKTSKEAEILQSFMRVDDGDESDAHKPGNKFKTTAIAKFKASGSGALISAPPKKDVYTPIRKETSNISDYSKLIAEQKRQDVKKKEMEMGGGKKGKRAGKGHRRKKKKIPRCEELYTDKDRAAAVNMGSRDIKQSLSMKKKQDLSRIFEMPSEVVNGTFVILGNQQMRSGHMTQAMNFFNKGLELNPDDKDALVARSKCHVLLGNAAEALEDAERALKLDKKFSEAIYQKAEALYNLGKFEYALMYYHRGLKIRPELDRFRRGVQKSQEAIEKTIGPQVKVGAGLGMLSGSETSLVGPRNLLSTLSSANSSNTSQKDDPLAMGNTLKPPEDPRINHEKKAVEPIKGRLPTPSSSSTSRRANRSKSACPVMANLPKTVSYSAHVLGPLHVDMKYLEALANHPSLTCFNKENKRVVDSVNETITYLSNRQKFWEQQRPVSSVKKVG